MTDISKIYHLVLGYLDENRNQRSVATDLAFKIADLIKESNTAVIEEIQDEINQDQYVHECTNEFGHTTSEGFDYDKEEVDKYLKELKLQQGGKK